jgi:putative tryptophan/tyrosine transport system substrate-binding protein
LPAIYGPREFVEAGGLMAYGADPGELGRRMAEDVHQILNGAKPGDIPIFQATRFCIRHQSESGQGPRPHHSAGLLAAADEVSE